MALLMELALGLLMAAGALSVLVAESGERDGIVILDHRKADKWQSHN